MSRLTDGATTEARVGEVPVGECFNNLTFVAWSMGAPLPASGDATPRLGVITIGPFSKGQSGDVCTVFPTAPGWNLVRCKHQLLLLSLHGCSHQIVVLLQTRDDFTALIWNAFSLFLHQEALSGQFLALSSMLPLDPAHLTEINRVPAMCQHCALGVLAAVYTPWALGVHLL